MYAKYLELAASSLLLTLLSLYLLEPFIKHNRIKMFVCSVILFIIFLYVPIYQDASLSKLIRGFYSDLSISFICLIVVAYINQIAYIRKKIFLPKMLSLIIVVLAMLLYLSAFGVISYDIYSHGYMLNNYMLLMVGVFCAFIYFLHKKYAWVLLISLCAYYFKLLPSNNIFDYFIDIPLVMIALLSLLKNKLTNHNS